MKANFGRTFHAARSGAVWVTSASGRARANQPASESLANTSAGETGNDSTPSKRIMDGGPPGRQLGSLGIIRPAGRPPDGPRAGKSRPDWRAEPPIASYCSL